MGLWGQAASQSVGVSNGRAVIMIAKLLQKSVYWKVPQWLEYNNTAVNQRCRLQRCVNLSHARMHKHWEYMLKPAYKRDHMLLKVQLPQKISSCHDCWSALVENKPWQKLSTAYCCFSGQRTGLLCILCNQSATLSPGQSEICNISPGYIRGLGQGKWRII